jgi:hypothetical protein
MVFRMCNGDGLIARNNKLWCQNRPTALCCAVSFLKEHASSSGILSHSMNLRLGVEIIHLFVSLSARFVTFALSSFLLGFRFGMGASTS